VFTNTKKFKGAEVGGYWLRFKSSEMAAILAIRRELKRKAHKIYAGCVS
jgi:hypothetical protein